MFERLSRILTEEEISKIKNLNILIIGRGGVGGAAFEGLVRMGVTNITAIDNDKFEESNLNRQILSNKTNIGQFKALEAKIRANNINNECLIDSRVMFLNEENIDELEITKYDYILDCCDSLNTKILLIEYSIKYNIKIISCMGTGNRFDPTKLVITDIWKTNNDPLAKKVRLLLRKKKINKKIRVVTSTETPRKSSNGVGSTSLVPNWAGFFMASFVINDII